MFRECIYLAGVKYRNPSLLEQFDFLTNVSESWTYDQLKDYQFLKCKDLLVFAFLHSSYWKRVFNEIGFNPAFMTSLDVLKSIPIIDKSVLLKYNKEIHTDYKFNKLFISETSGTSGQVLKFYRNEEWESGTRAAMFRGYHWYGLKPWDRNGYFWGYNIKPQKRLIIALQDELQNRFRLFSYNEEKIKRFVHKLYHAKYLSGYSSMIYEVAKVVNQLNLKEQFNLKMIKGTSEKIYDSYQDEVQKAFGKKIISEYGSSESGIIAFECPEGNMHLAMENVILEEVNGEAVVTNLLSKSFPIIRYKLGDYIKLAPENFKCKCGRSHLVLLDVLGRVGKKIIGFKSIYPSLTLYYVFKNLSLERGVSLNYQGVQNEKGIVLLKIEQNENLEILALLKAELTKYFHDDVRFEIVWGTKFHEMDGKLRDFITNLD